MSRTSRPAIRNGISLILLPQYQDGPGFRLPSNGSKKPDWPRRNLIRNDVSLCLRISNANFCSESSLPTRRSTDRLFSLTAMITDRENRPVAIRDSAFFPAMPNIADCRATDSRLASGRLIAGPASTVVTLRERIALCRDRPSDHKPRPNRNTAPTIETWRRVPFAADQSLDLPDPIKADRYPIPNR